MILLGHWNEKDQEIALKEKEEKVLAKLKTIMK
jgi:hypothetical protein